MKYFISLLILMSFVQLSYSSTCKTNNYILIHGIGGSANSFGHMSEVLENHLECAKVYEFSYATAQSNLSVLDFSKSLAEFIDTIPQEQNKDINFIMHSQGGIVGLTYIINSFHNNAGFKKDQLNRFNKYVSMSTPFWGSDFALMGNKLLFSLGVKRNKLSPFGNIQLEDMKYGSDINQERSSILQDSNQQELIKYLKDLSSLNISAMAPYSSTLLDNNSSQFFEGDLIVNIPSMTQNTIQIKTGKEYRGESTEMPIYTESILSDQAYVIGTHLDVYFGTFGYGIVDVPKSCLNLDECDHPGYMTLYNYLQNDIVLTNKEVQESIKGFEVQLKVNLPSSDYDPKDIRVEVLESNDKSTIDMSNYRFKGSDVSAIKTTKEQAFFLLKGSIMSKSKDASLKIRIYHPELKARVLDVYVQKGLVTHLKTNINEMEK